MLKKSYLEKIDTETIGNRYDVTPLFGNADCFVELVTDLVEPFANLAVDGVACIDALGFILGTAIACRLNVGVIPIRKGGKLPVKVVRVTFRDYSGETKALEIRADSQFDGQRILLVDEWIETGAQMGAAAELIETQGGIVVGIATINMDENAATAQIRNKYPVHAVR